MSWSQILAVLVAAFVVTQIAIFTTSVYLHRSLTLAGAINAVGHQYGTRPYRNSATNLRPLAIVTGGEGLHNNHHAAPTSARFSLHRGELDPGWWVVRALTAVRLAHVRHDDVHLKPVA
jgi:stearoyl-CoA desaturase (delta-9 desaturase)